MAYEQSSYDYATDPRTQYSVAHEHLEAHRARPRGSSVSHGDRNMADQARHTRSQQPIDEAVTSAFDTADTAQHVPPDLIAKITESVIQQLKTTAVGESGTTPVPQGQNNYPPPPVHQPVPLSPSTVSGSSPPTANRKVYTPPSPQKHSDYAGHSSPPPPAAYPQSHSPRQTPAANIGERRPSSPLSQGSETSHTRPKGPIRLSTGKEETTLEKIWGQLFDEECHPTTRLGQFLRGLAVHIIEDYEPQHSIVITPTKMVQYYEAVRLPHEIYPWPTVFDDERSSISRMYRELECQHHLVQERFDERPDIPGLTPLGFERWVTLLIQAHPEEEYGRLQKAVLSMPISNPDDKKERFPKEISRRLFPGCEDGHVREKLEKAISEHAQIDIPRRSEQGSPVHRQSVTEPHSQSSSQYVPPSQRREPSVTLETGTSSYLPSSLERERKPYSNTPTEPTIDDTNSAPSSAQPYMPSHIERERMPYSNVPSESAIDDTNATAIPQPIERERKPYSAQPGCGKTHEEELNAREAGKPRSDSTSVKQPVRSDSSARARPILVGAAVPRAADFPKPEIHQHHRAPSNARRHRSPSFSRGGGDFRRSDGDLRNYQPTFQPSAIPDTYDDDARRYVRDRDRARRQADEDARAYGESPSNRSRYEPPSRASFLGTDEDYYRAAGRGSGNGYDYSQQAYGGPTYR